jgi:hypothetical protein
VKAVLATTKSMGFWSSNPRLCVVVRGCLLGIQNFDGVAEYCFALTVTNRGTAATTITNMVLYNYPSRLSLALSRFPRRLFQRPGFFGDGMRGEDRRPSLSTPLGCHLHMCLSQAGTGMGWRHTPPELEKMIAGGRLFVGVVGSHIDKPLFKKVQQWIPPKDTKRL